MISIIEYLSHNRGQKCTKEIGHYLENLYSSKIWLQLE